MGFEDRLLGSSPSSGTYLLSDRHISYLLCASVSPVNTVFTQYLPSFLGKHPGQWSADITITIALTTVTPSFCLAHVPLPHTRCHSPGPAHPGVGKRVPALESCTHTFNPQLLIPYQLQGAE